MANRSYLYASDLVPARGVEPSARRIVGISEWNWDIPVAYKLLASGEPQMCISSIWKLDEEIAIVGDYQAVLLRLFAYLDGIPESLIGADRDEARARFSWPRRTGARISCWSVRSSSTWAIWSRRTDVC